MRLNLHHQATPGKSWSASRASLAADNLTWGSCTIAPVTLLRTCHCQITSKGHQGDHDMISLPYSGHNHNHVTMASTSGQIPTGAAGTGAGAGVNVNGINGGRVYNSASPAIASASASPALQSTALQSQSLNINSKSKSPPSQIGSDLTASKPKPSPAAVPGTYGSYLLGSNNSSSSPSMSVKPNVTTPSSARAPQPVLATGFPSPGREAFHANKKFIDDRARLSLDVREALPEAVRRAVRDNWEKTLVGSDFHQAFVVSLASYPPLHTYQL